MNKTFLISYDLGMPEDSLSYDRVIEYIKSLGTWAKPLQSVWFVVTDISAVDIRSSLQNLTDINDKVLVMDVTDNYWATARINEKVTEWMKINL